MSKGRTIHPTPSPKSGGRRKRSPVSLERMVPSGAKDSALHLPNRPVMVLVLGPHRSGTSVIARLMECLGARNSAHTIAGDANNPTGYFEDADINTFNDTVLLPRLGLQWHSIGFVDWSRLNKTDRSRLGLQALEIVRRNYPATQPLSVLKEPRIGVLLPFWLSVLGHAGFDVRIVCAVRDPVSIARSLAARDNFSITHGGMLYVTSWLSILPHIEDLPVALVEFDTVFTQPGKVLRGVAEKLRLPLPADLDERLHEFTSNHLDPSLRHSRLPAEDVALEPDLPPLAAQLHAALVSAARSQNIKKAARVALASDRTIEAFRPVLADFDQLLAGTRGRRPAPEATAPVAPAQMADTTTEALARERDQLAAQLAQAQAAREEVAARLDAAEVMRQETAARQAALAEATARLAAAEQEVQELRANAEQQRQDHGAQAQLEELERCHEDLAARHRALVEERASLEDERDRLLAEVGEARAEQEAQATRLNELEANRHELAARHAALQSTHDEMAARAAEADSLRHEVSARQAVLAETQGKADAAEKALAEARTAREQAEADAKDKAEENELLLAQLHQVQEELEKYFLENRELKQSADQLRATKEAHQALNALHQELADAHTSLVSRHASLVTSEKDLAAHHSTLESDHASLVEEHDALERSAREEKARLTEEVQKLGRDLAEQSRQVRALDDLAARRLQELAKLGAVVVQKTAALGELETVAAYSGENNFRIRRIEVLDSHETPPHRHLNLVLHDVSLGGRELPRLPVRLVEHHGRVGLVFLRPPELADPPLLGWVESGRDGDLPFMLVIPADGASRTFLQTAGGSDQYFIRFIASTLDDALLNRHAHCPPGGWEAARVRKWLPVARALVRQLEQLPARLHYDRAVAVPGPQRDTWSFDLSNVFFAGRSMARLACEWKPAAHNGQGELVLRLAEASAAPLLAWPHHDDHTPATEVAVKFAPFPWGGAPRGANGSALEETDHAFLRGLVAELPVLVAEAAKQQGLAAKEQKHLQKLARRAAAGQVHLAT